MLFVIYGASYCKPCLNAKKLLDACGLRYEFVPISPQVKKALELELGKPISTIPQVFCGDSYIGGYDDLQEYINKAVLK